MKREVGEEHVSMVLRSLPPRVPPTELTTSLRVIASRERQRVVEGRSVGQVFALWFDRTRLTLRDMLRPLMLPATGGVFSAVVLFSMWVVPTYPLRAKIAFDIPTNLTTSVDVDVVKGSGSVGLTDSVVVDVDVDDQGRMVDYQVVSGASAVSDPTTRHRMENLLWFTKFEPATTFGMPMAGKARVLLLPSPWIFSVPRSDWPGIYVKG
ncbi:MAG: hypothetical protein JWO19_3096 [Bryobacterales bacterium]|jgi:hypothetical protein|nr:hypothetical protein [Bryobacterales bacterium]